MSTPTALRQIIRDTLASAEDVSVDAIAQAVMAQASTDPLPALAEALPALVREVIVASRQPGRVHPPASAGVKQLPGSWKVAAIRDGWQKRLAEVYATESGNRRVGDMTYDDLLFLADLNERQAKQKLSKAKGWRDLADLLHEQGVERVRDLDAQTLMTTFGSAA